MTDLSIIIVNWNTRQLLYDCLHSIFQHKGKLSLQVIVVDNHSEDGSGEMVKEIFSEVFLVNSGKNLGFARANNLGVRQASGQFILFLNPDTLFIDDSLEKVVDFYARTPGAGFVGCRLLNGDGSLQPSAFPFPGLWGFAAANLGLHVFLPPFLRRKIVFKKEDYQSLLQVDWMRGAFLLASRKNLEEIGYFDENLFMYAEDLDLCLRMKKSGRQNYYFPETQIIHYGNQAGELRFGTERLQRTFEAFDYVATKHFGKGFARRYELITSITSLLKAARCEMIRLFLPARRASEIARQQHYREIARITWKLAWRRSVSPPSR
jgi:GT2 family glycosyltransferase